MKPQPKLTLEEAIAAIRRYYRWEPYIRISCECYSDEHWQFRRDPNSEFPEFTLCQGVLEIHPDAKFLTIIQDIIK